LDIEDQIATVRAQFLNVKVWLVETDEDLTKVLKHSEKYKYIAYDTETTSIDKAKTVPNVIMWSLAVKANEAFIVPYKFNKRLFEWITTTDKNIVVQNGGFDNRIVHWNTGKHIKNAQDLLGISYVMLNDSVLTPSISLKTVAKKDYGMWSEKGGSYDITDLQYSDVDNVDLQYYAGIDAMSLSHSFSKYITELEATESVEIENVLPASLPKDRGYTRMWFYKNVAMKLLPITIEFMNNGLPLDLDQVHKLDTHLDDILEEAENGVRKLETVKTYWENLRSSKASEASSKYLETVDIDNVKIYKSTNQDYINLFVETLYKDKVLPSKAKNWSATVVKTFDPTLAQAIKDKDLERLRSLYPYDCVFIQVEGHLGRVAKLKKFKKSQETAKNQVSKVMLDFEFNPLGSSQQKKFILQKGFGIKSNTKSMTTGEDSFNRAELERLQKEVQEGTELHTYLTHLLTYSGGAIIKKNFVKNFLAHSTDDSRIHSSVRLFATKTFRLGGGGKVNLLALPSSRSPFSKPVKKCIAVPSDDWVWIGSDYQALEVSANASITQDPTLVKMLDEGFDMHCNNSAAYFKEEIEAILSVNDGSIDWNKNYKKETFNNPRLDKLRSNSKAITFSLQYLSGIPGLYKAVGYLGDVYEDRVKIDTDTYKFTFDVKSNGDYYVANQNAKWYSIDNYLEIVTDTELLEFFRVAVFPAYTMHYRYHNELYYGSKEYRDKVIVPQVKKHKNLHMGLGAYINQTRRLNNGSIRSLWNAGFQFWSLLPLIALTKFMKIVREKGYDNDVKPIISIYDSVYLLVRNDKEIIKWVAETLQPILEAQYLIDQPIPLVSDIEISTTNWAEFISYKEWLETTVSD